MTNDQAPMTKQIQSMKCEIQNARSTRVLNFGFRISCLFVIWCLVIGASADAVTGASGATSKPTITDRLMPLTHSSPRPTTAPVDVILLHFSSDFLQHPDD